MTENLPDRLDGDISVSASIEQTGIKASAKGRAFVAIDRLIGGAVDIIAVKVEGIRNRELLRNEVKTAALQIEGAKYLSNLDGIPDLARRGLEHMMREEERKQFNRERVAAATVEQLGLPSPSGAPSNDEIDSHDTPMDEDWLNVFSQHAANASSERFQILWGRILAGEIRKPGSFSLSTIRVISELDATVAKLFQEMVANRITSFIPRGQALSGQKLLDAGTLVESGLLQDTGSAIHMNLGPGFILHGENYGLKLGIPEGQTWQLPIIPLSRAGAEIAQILPYDEVAAMKRAATLMDGTFPIYLCTRRPHPTDKDSVLFTTTQMLRAAS